MGGESICHRGRVRFVRNNFIRMVQAMTDNKLTAERINEGDTVTIDGIYWSVPNPARRWWQIWKPRLVSSDEMQTFTVVPALRAQQEPPNDQR